MLNIKTSKIIEYAFSKEEIVLQALKEFFGNDIPGPEQPIHQEISGLFNEWLIYDYKLPNKTTFAKEYFLKNPDNLGKSLLNELEQILKTQFYDLLEITEIKPGQWLKVYSFKKGKNFKIWDKLGSMSARRKSTITGRLAKINNRWNLVGSDGIQLPFYSTQRHKKFMHQAEGGFQFTPKDTLKLLIKKESSDQSLQQKIYTKKNIKNKRKKLKKKFEKLTKKYNFQLPFQKVVDFIYNENYQSNHADMGKDLIKLGIPKKALLNSTKLFQDIWNFFPHKTLKGKCPQEMFQETYL